MSSKIKMAFTYIFLGIVTIISIFPLLWMFIAATNKSVDVIAGKLSLGTYIAENYKNLLSQQPLWSSFFNSCKYTLLVTAFALVVSSLAGYAFEIYKDKGGEFRFRLKAKNGQIIATSEGYKAKASCKNGIESVRKNTVDAEIVEIKE